MNDFDRYCVMCDGTLPVGSHPEKEYCDKCWIIHRKKYNQTKYYEKVYRTKLKKFYSFQRIPLILSPYFSDKRIERVMIP